MTVRVDRTKCSGIGLCEMTAPEVFEVGDDGRSRVIEPEPSGPDLESARRAAADCPTGALSLTD